MTYHEYTGSHAWRTAPGGKGGQQSRLFVRRSIASELLGKTESGS
jgi:hypothetical protein